MSRHSIILVTVAVTTLLNSCNLSSEQGPVGLSSIQKAQKRGSMPTDDYEIIDINNDNIGKYNNAPVFSSSILPKVDFSKTYSDAIRPYDRLILQIVDAGSGSGIASQDKLPAQFGPKRFLRRVGFPFPMWASLMFLVKKSPMFKMKSKRLIRLCLTPLGYL